MSDAENAAKLRRYEVFKHVLNALDVGFDGYEALPGYLSQNLTEREIAGLMWHLAKAMPWDHLETVIESITTPAGSVHAMPNGGEYGWQAERWSEDAPVGEIKAYISKGYKALPQGEKQKIRDWMRK